MKIERLPKILNRFNSTLVRFKPEALTRGVCTAFMFQFHSGSIQTRSMKVRIAGYVCFNSTLVRFKHVNTSYVQLDFACFNSTLVRFKHMGQDFSGIRSRKFQFHSGSIQTVKEDSNISQVLVRFNSTLVRFKLNSSLIVPTGICVSIPLWFDSNLRERKKVQQPTTKFQFHSGSIQTEKPAATLQGSYCFNSTLVRFKPSLWARSSSTTFLVSIPLWFDSNGITQGLCHIPRKFQFHSGSIQTIVNFAADELTRPFQFHSGSIQTTRESGVRAAAKVVSIPLWFDSNRWGSCLCAGDSAFQFHSGSIQTFHKHNQVLANVCFNSTLVRFKL